MVSVFMEYSCRGYFKGVHETRKSHVNRRIQGTKTQIQPRMGKEEETITIHCILNRLGEGKTLLLTVMAISNYLKGREVFSNYQLEIPHTRLHSLEDVNQIRQGFFAADDFYIWANSRRFKDNRGIDLVLGKSRKRGIDIAWTATRPMQVDINIRINTHFAWVPQLFMRPDPKNPKARLPWFMVVRKHMFIPEVKEETDFLGDLVEKMVIPPKVVEKAMNLYDTIEEVEDLQ